MFSYPVLGPGLSLRALLAVCAAVLVGSPAAAATIDWTSWTSSTQGGNALLGGAADGSLSVLGVGVSYTGQMGGLEDASIWEPGSTFTGGLVDNAPPNGPDNGIQLNGGIGTLESTITFDAPVTNPIIAIWSLGTVVQQAYFNFDDEPFVLEGGGASDDFPGGSSLFVAGSEPDGFICPVGAVCGAEGNGIIRFTGTFTELTWTIPVFENYYVFTVGAPDGSAIPEPGTAALVALGLAGLGWNGRRR